MNEQMTPQERAAAVNVLSQYIPVTESGCWLWLGNCNPKGYGRFMRQGKTFMAHRASYEVHRGPIPEGLQLDHLCRVRCCINPDHLEPVTARENVMRGISFAAINAAMKTCRLGHPLKSTKRYRHCRICATVRSNRYKAVKRLERLDRLAQEGS